MIALSPLGKETLHSRPLLRNANLLTCRFNIQSTIHLAPNLSHKILDTCLWHACGFAPSKGRNLNEILALNRQVNKFTFLIARSFTPNDLIAENPAAPCNLQYHATCSTMQKKEVVCEHADHRTKKE